MKLDPPEMFDGKTAPYAMQWLTAIQRWARLTGIPYDYLYEAVATRMKGDAAT